MSRLLTSTSASRVPGFAGPIRALPRDVTGRTRNAVWASRPLAVRFRTQGGGQPPERRVWHGVQVVLHGFLGRSARSLARMMSSSAAARIVNPPPRSTVAVAPAPRAARGGRLGIPGRPAHRKPGVGHPRRHAGHVQGRGIDLNEQGARLRVVIPATRSAGRATPGGRGEVVEVGPVPALGNRCPGSDAWRRRRAAAPPTVRYSTPWWFRTSIKRGRS
jgi:hypothetical protein